MITQGLSQSQQLAVTQEEGTKIQKRIQHHQQQQQGLKLMNNKSNNKNYQTEWLLVPSEA